MKYQIADLNNGPFGDIYDTLEEAEAALAYEIEEGKKLNIENAVDGYPVADASEFFEIVEVEEEDEE
jgi:hypothetical protein